MVSYPGVHGDYLAAKEDLARLDQLLEQTRQRYERELRAASCIPSSTRLTDGLIAFFSLGFARLPDRQLEIENKKRVIHRTFCRLIDQIEKEKAQLFTDFQRCSELERQFTISVKYSVRADGYPSNWEEISRTVRERDDYRCKSCGKTDFILHVHHVISLSRGGSNSMSNLTTLCEKCHIDKHPHMAR